MHAIAFAQAREAVANLLDAVAPNASEPSDGASLDSVFAGIAGILP